MSASELRKRLSEAKVGQFFNICVDAITYAERLEAENKRLRDNLRSAIVGVLADLREADRLRYGFDWPGLLPIADKIIDRAAIEGGDDENE